MSKLKDALLKNKTFPLLLAVLCAAVFAGGHMLVTHGFGSFSGVDQAQMIRHGLETGDFSTPLGYCAGFLIARVMEGPLVGILDIGGSVMTGVGTGMVSLCLTLGLDWIVSSFIFSLLTGALIGLALGIIIIAVKSTMPQGMAAGGTNIMMGAGNSSGRWFAPLVIISAIQYSIPAGIGAILGSFIFMKLDKPMTGGTILGSMLLGALFI